MALRKLHFDFLNTFQVQHLSSNCISYKSNGTTFLGSRLHRFSTSPQIKNKTLVDGINLHWEKFGNGPHVALCLPGLVGSIKQHFLPVSKKMDLTKFTLIAMDPPGYGRSRPPERVCNMEEKLLCWDDSRLAGGLMKELGYDKYSIIGYSLGGVTGALMASAFPAQILKLVVCNTKLTFRVCDASRTLAAIEVLSSVDSFPPSQLEAILEDYERPYLEKMLAGWKQYGKMCVTDVNRQNFVLRELEKIRAPVLCIRGGADLIIRHEDTTHYAQYIKNFKLHTVPNAGHNHLEFLDEFVSATENFLSPNN